MYVITGSTILTDAIFFAYGGGQAGSGTASQRLASYQMAETWAAMEIGTFLQPTEVESIFQWWPSNRLQLPHKYVSNVNGVTALHEIACNCEDLEIGGCAVIVSVENGVIDLRACGGGGNCACAWATGYAGSAARRVRVNYTAGIQTGLAASYAGVLQGLTIGADIALTQMIDCGADGDPQITSFSDSGYSETRQGLIMTQFGGSVRANFAARMFEPLKYHGALRMK